MLSNKRLADLEPDVEEVRKPGSACFRVAYYFIEDILRSAIAGKSVLDEP
jgi:hypothetical protein